MYNKKVIIEALKNLQSLKKPNVDNRLFKKGGSTKYTRDLINSTNFLFADNSLVKNKKKSKKRIFNPNAKYYANGGEPPETGLPQDFYEYWYKNRVMPTPEGQKLLDKIRPEALERSRQTIPYVYSDKLKPDDAGYYDTKTQEIILNKFLPEAQIEATKQHEFGHHIQAGKKFYNVLQEPHQYIVQENIIEPEKISTGNAEWDENLKKNYDDITQADEIHARIMTLRRVCGFEPNKVITEKDIQDCFKRKKEAGEALDPDIEDLRGVTKGNQSIVNLLNDMVSVPSNREDLNIAQYGGPPWNPDYPQPTTYEFQTLTPEEKKAREYAQWQCTEDQPCLETDQIQAYLNQGMDLPRKNVGLMWDVVDDVNNPSTEYYMNAEKKWKDMGLKQSLSERLPSSIPFNCMWAAGSGWQCLSDTKDQFKKLPLSAFESNDKFINAVDKGTIPFERVAKINKDKFFDDQRKGLLKTGDIINFKGPNTSHAMTFSHYREDGVPIYLDSNGSPMNFDWNEGLYTNIKPGNGVTAYISRFSPEKFYQDKIKKLEEKARTNPTRYDEGGTIDCPPGYAKSPYGNDCIPVVNKKEVTVEYTPQWKKDRDKFGKDHISWYESWNPKKWGLNDYSDYSSFNSAFRNARESGENEFVYKGERYSTELVPQAESDLYWESKDFINQYYNTQPYKKSNAYDQFDYNSIQNTNKYIKKKYNTTFLDAYNKQQKIYEKLGEKAYANKEYKDLEALIDKITDEERKISNKTNQEYSSWYNVNVIDKEKKERLKSLNKPTYFSITSQKGDLKEDGSWDEKENKMFTTTAKGKNKNQWDKLNTTYVHELSHKADDILDLIDTYPKIDIAKLNASPFARNMTQETFNYLESPSEIQSRKLSTLFYLSKNKRNWKTGTITEKDLENLYDDYYDNKLPYDIEQLLQLYGAQQEDLLEYLNGTYNYKKKKGGFIEMQMDPLEINKYVKGGYIVEEIDSKPYIYNNKKVGGSIELTPDGPCPPFCSGALTKSTVKAIQPLIAPIISTGRGLFGYKPYEFKYLKDEYGYDIKPSAATLRSQQLSNFLNTAAQTVPNTIQSAFGPNTDISEMLGATSYSNYLNSVAPQQMQLIKELQNQNLVSENIDPGIFVNYPNLLDLAARSGVKNALTFTRSVEADDVAKSTSGTTTTIAPNDLAAFERHGIVDNQLGRAAYALTTIPWMRYGQRTGLTNLPYQVQYISTYKFGPKATDYVVAQTPTEAQRIIKDKYNIDVSLENLERKYVEQASPESLDALYTFPSNSGEPARVQKGIFDTDYGLYKGVLRYPFDYSGSAQDILRRYTGLQEKTFGKTPSLQRQRGANAEAGDIGAYTFTDKPTLQNSYIWQFGNLPEVPVVGYPGQQVFDLVNISYKPKFEQHKNELIKLYDLQNAGEYDKVINLLNDKILAGEFGNVESNKKAFEIDPEFPKMDKEGSKIMSDVYMNGVINPETGLIYEPGNLDNTKKDILNSTELQSMANRALAQYNAYLEWIQGGKIAYDPSETIRLPYSPFTGFKFEQPSIPGFTPEPIITFPNQPLNVTPTVVKPTWSMEKIPGLHLKSTMTDGAISKIVEPKTGLVNVEQALGIIGKESGGADKVALVKQGLGETIPKKMDYNEFRKVVQGQLIPLERQFVTHRSHYGIDKLGYSNIGHSWYENDVRKSNINNVPLENQTLILSNKGEFGRGSSAHGNPDETLGHIHFLIDAETPDVLTATQIQSDPFQGTHRSSMKTKEQLEFSLKRMEEHYEKMKDVYEGIIKLPDGTYQLPDGQKISKSLYENIYSGQKEAIDLTKAELKNFGQRQLLDKNHQERFLQELVDYAGSRGDINKLRLPTSQTAAKVQNYTKRKYSVFKFKNESIQNRLNNLGADVEEVEVAIDYKNQSSSKEEFIDKMLKRAGTQQIDKETLKLLEDIYNEPVEKIILEDNYSPKHQTILKKYSELPKIIKKLFGVEPKIVTDAKGNTWYEFEIPESYKVGEGEIKAFAKGGLVDALGDYELGDEVDADTAAKLKELGYTLELV